MKCEQIKDYAQHFFTSFLGHRGKFWQAYIKLSYSFYLFFPSTSASSYKACISFFQFSESSSQDDWHWQFPQLRTPIVNEKWTSRVVIVTASRGDRVNGNYSRYEELSSHYGSISTFRFLVKSFFSFFVDPFNRLSLEQWRKWKIYRIERENGRRALQKP